MYGNGEFARTGLWTVINPPPEVHDDLVSAWDFNGSPLSRWCLPVCSGARLWDIERPSDWVRLVGSYPKVAARAHSGSEWSGPNQHPSDTRMLRPLENQHAVRISVNRHLLPDWETITRDFDGVHLSWAGFLTTEGFVSDLADGGVTMLRYWGSERTLCLHDIFGDPTPLDPPTTSGRFSEVFEINISHVDDRRAQGPLVLNALLERG
jgi:hypothetical protein